MSLTDYQRGYRAAQHRALSVAEANLARNEPQGIVTAFKIALSQPVPPDPHTLVQSEDARIRREDIRRIIREELPGLLNAVAVRRLAQKIEEGIR